MLRIISHILHPYQRLFDFIERYCYRLWISVIIKAVKLAPIANPTPVIWLYLPLKREKTSNFAKF